MKVASVKEIVNKKSFDTDYIQLKQLKQLKKIKINNLYIKRLIFICLQPNLLSFPSFNSNRQNPTGPTITSMFNAETSNVSEDFPVV